MSRAGVHGGRGLVGILVAVLALSLTAACTKRYANVVAVATGAGGSVAVVVRLCSGDSATSIGLHEVDEGPDHAFSVSPPLWLIENQADHRRDFSVPLFTTPPGWRLAFHDIDALSSDAHYIVGADTRTNPSLDVEFRPADLSALAGGQVWMMKRDGSYGAASLAEFEDRARTSCG